jgi:predicted glycosyltransferase
MKSLIAVLALTLIVPTISHAKLQVFRAEDAAKLVLNDSATMEKAKKLAEIDAFQSLAVESEEMNKFNVKLELGNEDYSCSLDVAVVAKAEAVILPGGGKIATNKLVVKSVKKERCISK